MDESNYPPREIEEDEEELLDRLWSAVDAPAARPEADAAGYRDLKRRIRRRVQRRRAWRMVWIGSAAAAVVAAGIFLWPQLPPAPPADAFAQLERMGVAVERPEVVMTADDGLRLSLETAARLEPHAEGTVAVRTERGERAQLDGERKLRVDVPAGRQFSLTLADGSQVWLNAGSTLEYPATFSNASERRVRIEGEAFFDIRCDTCRPFCVELAGGEAIRVLGTQFNVNAYAGSGRRVTTLVAGRVRYTADGGRREVTLRPNEQVRSDAAGGTWRVETVDATAYGAWKEGWLWFENEPLSGLAERLAREYGIRVEVADRVRGYTFSGKIRRDRGIGYLLNLFSETSDVACEVSEGVMRLK